MNKIYNNQKDLSSKIAIKLKQIIPDIRKTQLNIIPFIILGMILSESAIASDISKHLKDDFSLVQHESVVKRIRRLFKNKLFNPYDFYLKIIKWVISNYKKKHNDNRIHIIFDHMYSKDNFTVLLFSFRIGKQGIPIWFKCFKGIHNPDAFVDETIISGIDDVISLFANSNFDLIFLADRWFNSQGVINHLIKSNVKFYIRFKGNINVSVFDIKEKHYIRKTLDDLFAYQYHSNFFYDAYLYDDKTTKVNIAISKKNDISSAWIIVTNSDPKRAIKDYAYRFGGIETIFKNQKSNGFYLESTSNCSLQYFESLFSLVCVSVLFLTIIGADFAKNTKCYKNVKIKTHTYSHGKKIRTLSLFNTGLTLFKRAYCSSIYIRIPISFILYDS